MPPAFPGRRRRSVLVSALAFAFALSLFLVLPACNDKTTGPDTGGPGRKVYVPGTYDTVTEALAEAVSGDSIFVELVAFEPLTGTIEVRAEQTPLVLIGTKSRPQLVAASNSEPLIHFVNPKRGTAVENMAFAGGNPAVQATGPGYLELHRCIFTGGAVHVRALGSAHVGVEECVSVGASLFGITGDDTAQIQAVRNTILKAGDCGVLLGGASTGDIRANIIGRSVNYGIACTGSGALADTSGCNDVWLSGQEPYLGCTAPDGDFSFDPLFCGESTGDYTINEISPCAPLNSAGCGTIGALGVACAPEPEAPSE